MSTVKPVTDGFAVVFLFRAENLTVHARHFSTASKFRSLFRSTFAELSVSRSTVKNPSVSDPSAFAEISVFKGHGGEPQGAEIFDRLSSAADFLTTCGRCVTKFLPRCDWIGI
jgi:hypothetical protein